MTSEAPLGLMTAQELLQYTHEPYRQELVDGILHEMEPPGAEHGAVAATIGFDLMRHVRDHRLGFVFANEVGFRLTSDPDTVRAPDLAFVARDRVAGAGMPKGFWPGPPDLAVEVVSPHDRRANVEAKALEWLAAGTRAAIVVDPPTRTATVFLGDEDVRVLQSDERIDIGDVVRGWTPLVGGFFAF